MPYYFFKKIKVNSFAVIWSNIACYSFNFSFTFSCSIAIGSFLRSKNHFYLICSNLALTESHVKPRIKLIIIMFCLNIKKFVLRNRDRGETGKSERNLSLFIRDYMPFMQTYITSAKSICKSRASVQYTVHPRIICHKCMG